MLPPEMRRLAGTVIRVACRAEDMAAALALLAMAALPVLELLLRSAFGTGIPGNAVYVANLTLWVGFLGAMVASREGSHLTLSTGLERILGRRGIPVAGLVGAASAAVCAGLFWSALQFQIAGLPAPSMISGWLPEWALFLVLPLAFGILTLRACMTRNGFGPNWAALLAVGVCALLGLTGQAIAPWLAASCLAMLLLTGLLGAPVFVLIGGAALILLYAEDVPVASVTAEIYRIVVSPAIATIPLFTLTGFLLAEGGTTARLVRLFSAWFGWIPGGLTVAAVLLCGVFSAFTGATGVTILALGGVLLPILLRNGYPRRFSIGLLTGTGAIGLLFPPSLALIIYGVVAGVPIPDLFVAGVVPGSLMVAAACIYGVRTGVRAGVPRQRFDLGEGAAAIWAAKWEILLPAVAFMGIFGGFCTLAEAAAVTAVYALAIRLVVCRDIDVRTDLPRVLIRCAATVGGIFVILGAAMGLTNYFIDAEIPDLAIRMIQRFIDRPFLFLLALNLLLLAIGCLMDIFSATVVVLPLVIAMSQAYGIHPLHLAMIFLTNLELGYLTPPVGMNLFLASYRFNCTVPEAARSALPLLVLLLTVVILVTYAPLLGLVPSWQPR
jgi:tripartite ATP-independent transporter DctM subunit